MKHKSVQNGFFLGLVVLTTLAFVGLLQDFLQPLFWAAVLAVLFHSMQRWWTRRLGGRTSWAADSPSIRGMELVPITGRIRAG